MIAILSDLYADHPNYVTLLASLTAACVFTGRLVASQAPKAPPKRPSRKAATAIEYLHKKKQQQPAGFAAFQSYFLLTMGVVQLADWLQGTHFHALYGAHGLTDQQTSQLFLIGFLSSAICGTYIGAMVDSIGRRRGCVVYCVLEVIINALEHSTDFHVLLVGRVLGGISTSLLGCSFESWMVRAQGARLPDELLDQTFQWTSFLNGLLAVLGPHLTLSGRQLPPRPHRSLPSGYRPHRRRPRPRAPVGGELRRGGGGEDGRQGQGGRRRRRQRERARRDEPRAPPDGRRQPPLDAWARAGRL